MTSIRAFVCLGFAFALTSAGCSSSDAGDGGDASVDGACPHTDVCCCEGDVVDDPQCSADGTLSCRAGYTLYSGSDCLTKCTYPPPHDSGPRDTGIDTASSDGDAGDGDASDADAHADAHADADADADADAGSCTGWDADWGDTPKADVGSPCRSSCDCTGGFHCCAAAAGLTCAPAFECP